MNNYFLFLLTKSKIENTKTYIFYDKLIVSKKSSLRKYIEKEAKSDFQEYSGLWESNCYSIKGKKATMVWSYEHVSVNVGETKKNTIDEILID